MSDFEGNLAVLEGNLASLEERFPGIRAAYLGDTAPSPDLTAAAAKDGSLVAAWKGAALHSRVDPVREAERAVAEALAGGGADSLVLLGFGLGYHAEAAARIAPGLAVVVCEPDPARFLAALSLRDFRPLLATPRIALVGEGGPEALHAALELLECRSPRCVALRALEAEHAALFAALRERAGRLAARTKINDDTLARFGALWTRNIARNLEVLATEPSLGAAEGKAGGLPALVLAAGPSLDLALPLLPELARRAIVIAVDTASGPCLRAGVDPDFLVVVDPQYWNTRHLDRAALARGFLVTEAACHPAALRLPRRGLLLAASLHPLASAFEAIRGELPKLGAGGSVATSAWDLARYLGCQEAHMVGLDLGFPGGRTHVAGSFFEARELLSSCRLGGSERANFVWTSEARPSLLPANDGGRVRSDARMELYAWWFERKLAEGGAPHTVNHSPAGVAIAGMEKAALESMLDLPPARDAIEAAKDAIEAAAVRPTAPPEAFRAELDRLREGLGKLEGLAARGLDAIGRAGGDYGGLFAELDRVDAGITGEGARAIAGFLCPGLDRSLGWARSPEESAAQSRELYLKLRGAAAECGRALR